MVTATKDTPWQELAEEYGSNLSTELLTSLARELGVTPDSLQALSVGWRYQDGGVWTLPEWDGSGDVIGIMRRYRDGSKMAMAGSRRGIYIPRDWHVAKGPLFIPEGASDVAALLSLDLRAIGRPSCTGGVAQLSTLLEDFDERIYVVGENDSDGDGRWPGRDGAKEVAHALAAQLKRTVHWTMPPAGIKDVRDFLTQEVLHGT
jgi:hypothetical protein